MPIARSVLVLMFAIIAARAWSEGAPLADLQPLFAEQVDLQLAVPEDERRRYSEWLMDSLRRDGIAELTPQVVLLVDRAPAVQVAMLFEFSNGQPPRLIGASPVSTGEPGRFDYFETPMGVFRHSPGHPDFRAEGTLNKNGIRGYGEKGMRVYDFGWQPGRRGWGTGGVSLLRLQLHSTDPDRLEARLGTPQSKGCIRIPAGLNRFIDRYGLLDADYERAVQLGMKLPVLDEMRTPVAQAGRYLVIIDSGRGERPAWSRSPARPD